MAICGIYKITSPSGKIYIGQAFDIENRWSRYRSLNCRAQVHLYNSLKKHGSENHLFEILCECTEGELNEKENYYITLFDSFNSKHGLNLRSGGGRGEKLSEASRRKSGETQKLNWQKRRQKGTDKQSPETIQKRVASLKSTLEKRKEQGIFFRQSEEANESRRKKSKEYQIKIKQNPEYYSEGNVLKRKEAAKKALLTKKINGTTGIGRKRIPKFGAENGFYGKKHSKETIEKIQQKRRITWENKIAAGWRQSEEHIAKRVEKQLGRKRTPEQIENIRRGILEKQNKKAA